MKMSEVYMLRNLLHQLGSSAATTGLKWAIAPHMRALKPFMDDAVSTVGDLKSGSPGYQELEQEILAKEVEVSFPKPIQKSLIGEQCSVDVGGLMMLQDFGILED